jgi:cell division septum initiation protein DivIVA
MSASSENGLGLFDDAASAVGNFPSALRGYDRSAVDDYVRSLEGAVVQTRRRAASLEQQLSGLQQELTESLEKQREQEVDYTNLGGRATDILRLAEEQAREVLERAAEDAERLKETARRESDQLRSEAARVGSDIKSDGITEIQQLRLRGQEDVRLQIERAQAEAEAIVAAARREAEALQRAADHEAQTLRQNAYLDTEKLRREVELEVADTRQAIATERDAAIGHLRSVHEESVTKTAALLSEATEHHRQATERLDRDIAEAARVRAEALAEAEAVKLQAVQEAEERIAAARKQAAAITDRTQQEFAWRKQQLRRETDLLGQRKAAVLNQLASLSALAEQTAHAFPDMEDLDDFDGEQGDRTVMMPPTLAPSLPPQNGSRPATPPQAEDQGSDPAAVAEPDTSDDTHGRDESSTETRVFKPVSGTQPPPTGSEDSEDSESETDDTIQIDGDATVMVPPSQLPAGTGHLQGNVGAKS